MDVRGISFDNGLKLVAQYLDGFKWEGNASGDAGPAPAAKAIAAGSAGAASASLGAK